MVLVTWNTTAFVKHFTTRQYRHRPQIAADRLDWPLMRWISVLPSSNDQPVIDCTCAHHASHVVTVQPVSTNQLQQTTIVVEGLLQEAPRHTILTDIIRPQEILNFNFAGKTQQLTLRSMSNIIVGLSAVDRAWLIYPPDQSILEILELIASR